MGQISTNLVENRLLKALSAMYLQNTFDRTCDECRLETHNRRKRLRKSYFNDLDSLNRARSYIFRSPGMYLFSMWKYCELLWIHYDIRTTRYWTYATLRYSVLDILVLGTRHIGTRYWTFWYLVLDISVLNERQIGTSKDNNLIKLKKLFCIFFTFTL